MITIGNPTQVSQLRWRTEAAEKFVHSESACDVECHSAHKLCDLGYDGSSDEEGQIIPLNLGRFRRTVSEFLAFSQRRYDMKTAVDAASSHAYAR